MSTTRRCRHPYRRSLLPALLPAALLLLAACDDPFGSGGDRTPPQVVIESPSAGESVEADSAVVRGTVQDNRGVERVAFRLNGGPEQRVEATRGKTATFRFVLRDLAVGTHEVEVLAYDAADYAGTGKASFSTRDVKAPLLEVRTPAEGEMTGRDSVRVTGRATDDRGVASLAYSLDGGPEVAVPITPGKEVAFDFVVRGIPAGDHTLTVKTRDVGGTDAARSLRFTAPVADLRITTPTAGETVVTFVTPLRAIIDSPVGITRLTYGVNGANEVAMCYPQGIDRPLACQSFPAGRHELSWGVDALPQGDVRLRVTAYAGDRVAAAATLAFRVDVPVRRYRVAHVLRRPGWHVTADDLNDRGQVAGHLSDLSVTPGRERVFLWENGVFTERDEVLYTPNRVHLNEAGQVAGTALRQPAPSSYCTAAFLWIPGGAWHERPCRSEVQGLNDRGRVLVNVEENGIGTAHLWSPADGTVTPFRRDGYTWAKGEYLNNADEAVANLYRSGGGDAPKGIVRLSRTPEVVFPKDPHPCVVVVSLGEAGEWVCGQGIYRNGQLTNGTSMGTNAPVLKAANRKLETIGHYLWRGPRGPRDLGETRVAYWAGGTTYDVVIDDPAWELGRVPGGRIDINESGTILARAYNRTGNEFVTVLLVPAP